MTIAIIVTLSVLLCGVSIFSYILYTTLRDTQKKIKVIEKDININKNLTNTQKELEHILTTGVAAFLHISIKKSLDQMDILRKELDDAEELNTELSNWVVDFGKLTENVYKQLKSIDDRGIFEKDDEVGVIFQEMLDIITEYNYRINSVQNDDRNITTDEEQG